MGSFTDLCPSLGHSEDRLVCSQELIQVQVNNVLSALGHGSLGTEDAHWWSIE